MNMTYQEIIIKTVITVIETTEIAHKYGNDISRRK